MYAILGFFFGCLGIHDFYIGKAANAIAIILGSLFCTPFLVGIIVGIEILVTHRDSNGGVLREDNSAVPAILGILLIIANLILTPIAMLFYVPLLSGFVLPILAP